ncbi:MAG: histidine phosphatase family protein [Bacteroidales bacterium]|jgi:phosphohistidine phosphatase|nr:histidine phosphatase family protein [Bacteroidales bacterium]MCU0407568.1 histidine phosphatase family protein [Bacteroidales bacterium]
MKKIIFVRHGKAEDQGFDFPDFQRSLTAKGKVVARLMAGKLQEVEKNAGLFISSPAFRALETAIIFAVAYGTDPEKIILDSRIYYNMDMKYLRKLIDGLPEEVDTITLFGHNPSFTQEASEMAKDKISFMPKTSVAGISFRAGSWKEVKQGTGKIEYFLIPEKIL